MNPELFDLVAFTTTSRLRPFYRRDALNALCYPEKWILTLTYRQKWVNPALWRIARVNGVGAFGAKLGNSLRHRRTLVVLGVDPNEDEDVFRKFVPVRFGVVEYTNILGEGDHAILVVRLALQTRPSKRMVASFPGPFASLFTLPRPKKDSYYFVPIDRAPPGMTPREVTALLEGYYDWSDHVGYLRDHAPELKNCRYVSLAGIRSIGHSGERGPVARIGPGKSSRLTVVTLKAGKSYEASFHVDPSTVVPWTKPPLQVEVLGAHLEIATPVATQLGAAVDVYYILGAQRKYVTESVTMIAKTTNADGSIVQAGEGPEFQFLVRIQPPTFFWFWTIGLAAVGAFLLNISKEALQSLRFTGSDLELVLARVVGGLLLAIAGFYALRRLPVNKF